jgi:hypothetical protein
MFKRRLVPTFRIVSAIETVSFIVSLVHYVIEERVKAYGPP